MFQIASSVLILATFALAVPRISLIPSDALARRAASGSDDGFYPPDCKAHCEASSVDSCANVPDSQWHACHCATSVGQNLGLCESCLVAHNWFNTTSAQTLVDAYNKVCGTHVKVDPSIYLNSTSSSGASGSSTTFTAEPSTTSSIEGATHEGGGPGGPTKSGASPTGSPTGGQSPLSKGGAAGLNAAVGIVIVLASTVLTTLFIL
ncbi:hypothetical protein BJ138DRAFT_1125358 [Hygrophoropsis aurantiaca]|uniref:Uncharacterized protein n=1 Tax=Hygrophoropsis aurantiaca TaxID=72124 RepID=A0ACB8AH94_9AGAM|nr:hypothetical protein BJ138DRAFT_1125358 [Hygrophoropsis aurantiaca]